MKYDQTLINRVIFPCQDGSCLKIKVEWMKKVGLKKISINMQNKSVKDQSVSQIQLFLKGEVMQWNFKQMG